MSAEKSILIQNLRNILQRVSNIYALSNKLVEKTYIIPKKPPRLVVVSKTISVQQIFICYEEGQRHFGENYFQELDEKSHLLNTQCPGILWHFIGRLQSNKVKFFKQE